jgi:outer membrane protein assembly factor BamB
MGWGYNWSPLVDGKRLICVPGGPQGTLAALDKKTGAVIWRSKRFTDQATYSSPILAKVGGLRHYIQLTNEGITGIAAKDGALLWHYPKTYPDVLIPAPIFHDDQVYATGHLAGCDLVEVTATNKSVKAKKVYANRNMDNLEGGVLLVEGHVYGYSEGKGWVCQDFKTGKITASERRKLKRGSLAYADGHLYCYGEDDGTVVLVRAAPAQWTKTSWKEDGRFTIPRLSTLRKPRGKVWTHPVIADGKLFLRDQELLFCFDIKDHSAGNGSAAKGEDRGQ